MMQMSLLNHEDIEAHNPLIKKSIEVLEAKKKFCARAIDKICTFFN